MVSKTPQGSQYLFNHAQDLRNPSIFPPATRGKIPASVQFIIPGFKLGKSDKKNVTQLAHKCGIEVYGINTDLVQNDRTKELATLITFAFYVNPASNEEENKQVIQSVSRLLVERFLGLLSFFLGIKLSAAHMQYTTTGKKKGSYSKILPVSSRTSIPRITLQFPSDLESITSNDDIFSALFWLRRGLAERDPIENFSALMVCLQIMARHLVKKQPIVSKCPSCGAVLETKEPSITLLMRELVVSKLGATPKLFDRLWKARNAIVAHGNRPFTPKVFLELTELKFDAANLAFQSIKLGLGIPKDSPPSPNQAFFVTDAFMYVD
jgi:hypothetical protein